MQAEETGQRVEVVGERTERSTVYANPDGFSFTLEESVVPVRVATPDGGWVDPDPTLVRRADGSVGPKAVSVDVSFSGGGADTTLIKVAENGTSLSLGWPGQLPEPELDGASAVYRDVLPDVDLRVTASLEGVRHALVVKTPAAAAQQELKRIDYSVKAKGLSVREQPDGGLTAVDGNGQVVFRSSAAHMWDSAGEMTAAPKTAGPQGAAQAGSPAEAEAGSNARGLELDHGDNVTEMETDLASGTLSVFPDADMLSDTPPDAFPLLIDPPLSWGESERTVLRSDGRDEYGWDNRADGEGEGVGECGVWNGYACGDATGYRQRMYFEFSPSKLSGKRILDATFRITETWSFTCSPRWVQLWRTRNISRSSEWPGPKHLNMMGDRNVAAGRGSLCDPSQPNAEIEFHDNPNESNENLTPTVRDFADGEFSRFTLMLKARDEYDTSAWKRFKNNPVLAVKYVGKPAKPTNIGLVVGDDAVCETDASDPMVSTDPTPSLTATPQTQKGGEDGARLRVYFDIDEKNSDGSWSDSNAGNGSLRPSSGYVGDGHELTMSWSPLAEGKLYRYRAWTRSYWDGGDLASASNASTTGWCYFIVDQTAPKSPGISVSDPHTECLPNSCMAAGGPGQGIWFHFRPAEGDDDIVAYEWRLSSQDSWTSETEYPGTWDNPIVTTPTAGLNRLYVRGIDDAGREGAHATFDVLVKAGEGPVARWHFDELSGAAVDSATESDAERQDLSLGAGAARDDRGRRGLITHDPMGVPLEAPVTDRGLTLAGADGYASTDGAVVETRSQYTVSAWVRLENLDTDAIALSQDGTNFSPFILGYCNTHDAWCFGVKEQDVADGNNYFGTISIEPARAGVWTHLAGTYDSSSGELKVYVNGVLQNAETIPGSWAATGDFQIGRFKLPGGYGGHFTGSIDEVGVWQRALTDEEIAMEARLLTSEGYAGAELVADWDPAAGSGTSVPDGSGYGRDLTLAGGALLEDGGLVLDGQDDAGTTPGPLLDDTGSFTVTTAVALDGAAITAQDVGYVGQVLGQRTTDGSSWGIWFELTGKDVVFNPETGQEETVPVGVWRFGRLGDPSASVVSDQTAALDVTVRITGVYDAQAGKISLYLGYNQNGADQAYHAVAGSGDFAVGKGYTGGAWGHHLPARLTDVRLWAGAMASADQIRTTVGD